MQTYVPFRCRAALEWSDMPEALLFALTLSFAVVATVIAVSAVRVVSKLSVERAKPSSRQQAKFWVNTALLSLMFIAGFRLLERAGEGAVRVGMIGLLFLV